MALIPCKECGHRVSSIAAACPQCGAPIAPAPTPKPAGGSKVGVWLAWLLGVPLVLFVFFAVMGSNDPRIQAMHEARRDMEPCQQMMDDKLQSPIVRDAARQVCLAKRNAFVQRFGTEP